MFSILLMTHTQSLGELVKQALNDLEGYRVTLVHEVQDLLEILRIGYFHVVVLEMSQKDQSTELIQKLKQLNSEVRIVALIEGIFIGKKNKVIGYSTQVL